MRWFLALMSCCILMTSCSEATTGSDAAVADAIGATDALSPADAQAADAPAAPDVPAAPDAEPPADGGGLLPYGAPCAMASQCQTNVCERAGMVLICTAACMNGVCPFPNSSCNMRGICRPN